jgi:aspartate/tyrosine/aromatic aminotransferase
LQSRLQEVVVPEYLSPPINGARLVDEILSSKELTEEWKLELL